MQDLLRSVSNSYPEFSSGQKKVGDLFFKEPIFLAFSSALEVGRRVNVSESTVIRWTQKLGYKGYAEFQQVVQRKLAEERLEKAEQKRPEPIVDQSFLEKLLDADISSIVKLKKSINEDELLRVVDEISQADQVYVTSNFFDYGIADWFSNWLNLALGNTEMMQPSTGKYYTQISKLGKGHLVIAFAFPRYTRLVIETLKSAKAKGADVIVLTDSAESPAIAYADYVLTVSVNSNLNIDSYTSVHALLTSIMRFVYVKEQTKISGNLAKIEADYKERDLFI
ncbi:transcriptional regulator [Planococcus antarcticus DSM 14505]|uniref:Transcriptional regulator n=1 Tax=Planococcus antarcticus DSM 14505 TaxID=1185653 RepID=A0A1C7DEC5_9BACL|nr:MurR/RpiR family transcriptional regulator [Planococcus antarcticus]ANU09777.1 RpiR family transcriptional regulator [Planococcus antarcticus DSM 14505]EIM07626.1 transcriptional regulator [Planococcus antarcticus DSM 14505]